MNEDEMGEFKKKLIIDKRCPVCHKANYISSETPFGTRWTCTNPECRSVLIYEQTRQGIRLRSEKQLQVAHKKDIFISMKKLRYEYNSLKNQLTNKHNERDELINKLAIIDNELNAINNNMETLEHQIHLKFTKLDYFFEGEE